MSKIGGNVPLYDNAPTGKLQVEELDDLLSTRDNLLHNIEARIQLEKEKGSENSSGSRYRYHYLNPYLLDKTNEGKIGWEKNIENDKTSHFLMALAFCKNDQDRNWLANLESKLFYARCEFYDVDLEEVLKLLNIPLEKQESVSEAMLDKIRFTQRMNINLIRSDIYRIPFEYALNLVPTMQYFLYKGFVYISKAEMPTLIETVFKENLLKKLLLINRNLERIMSDSRVRSLITSFQTKREVETLSKSFKNVQTENISSNEIDFLAKEAFPLCMQILHNQLTKESHLKHWGRLQYGLFLKGIGLSLEESLNFWKKKFANKFPADKFEKEYSYNIRHSYGKEGKRNDYIPYSCNKIQMGIPAPASGDYHGCPFKVFSEEKLKNVIRDAGIKQELDVLKILEKVRNKEFSVK
jgi:DNA primase large subunit